MKTVYACLAALLINSAALKSQDLSSTFSLNPVQKSTVKTIQKKQEKHRWGLLAAIKNGLIKLKVMGQSTNLELDINNISSEDLEIVLEPGYIFKASGANSEKFQNIIIPTEQTFALSKKSKETFKLTGYCCNATRSSAKENTPFVIAGKASGSLMKLCNFINTHPLNPEGIQSAVHCFTDQKDANAITSNPLLKTFVQNLVGSMQNAIQIDQTLYVFKRIYYQLPESQHIKITIRDYAGNIVYEYHNPKLVKRGRYIYDFNLEAQDWAKGLYEVSINSPTATLAKEEFKI